MKVIMTCAGTGGHINPAIAIANILKTKDASTEIIFIGSKNGLENDLVKEAGYKIYSIGTGKLLRRLTFKNVSAMYKTWMGIYDAKKIIKKFKPDLVIGTGGYICGPVMLASKSFKIPYVLHESNAYPGITVKLLSKNSLLTMVGQKAAILRLKTKKNVVYTGTPSKFNEERINKLDYMTCKKELKLNTNKKIVFVTFGSQGAKVLNYTIINMIALNRDKDILYILVAGNNNYNNVLEKVKEIEDLNNIDLSNYLKVEKFIYEMDKMYKIADLCITRSGALTINELMIAKKPSILIPLPTAAENHQLYNAKIFENMETGVIIEQKNLNEKVLYTKIKEILSDEYLLNKMVKNFDKMDKLNIEDTIYDEIMKALKSRGESIGGKNK